MDESPIFATKYLVIVAESIFLPIIYLSIVSVLFFGIFGSNELFTAPLEVAFFGVQGLALIAIFLMSYILKLPKAT